MILVGNGPVPFVQTGPHSPGPGTTGSGSPPDGGAARGSIPAADPTRSGQAEQAGVSPTGTNAVRAPIAVTRIEPLPTDPEEIPARPSERGPRAASEFDLLAPRSNPAPPLRAFAEIPMEVTATIKKLREENQRLREQAADQQREIEAAEGRADKAEGNGARAASGEPGGTAPSISDNVDRAADAPRRNPRPEPPEIAAEVETLRLIMAPEPHKLDRQT
ncbi:hypothetical protein CLV78_109158 [Aliiruegeria haliotis]|uniref:Uncharacterized protein n=1 Tax=Aliiruegeria haliotis TaxID=1280846 RepID=A0A2T0RK30_9RHOB|nr:hypothetical protein [Aliiruegeria haliotis]PRY21545.1 hypothetical protein CLV78_109158 [Aliiruegeria haliotis]